MSESESVESTAMHDGPGFGSAAGDTFGFMTFFTFILLTVVFF